MLQPIPTPVFENFRVVLVRPGVDFVNATSSYIWAENSPLPPGTRYIELADLYVVAAEVYADYPFPQNVSFFGLDDSILPKDSAGNIRRNLKSCGVDVSSFNFIALEFLPSGAYIQYLLDSAYADDSMWTGEVVDPLVWQDDWWDALLINRERMAVYLEAHPACKLNA